jgi:hypothetical protein
MPGMAANGHLNGHAGGTPTGMAANGHLNGLAGGTATSNGAESVDAHIQSFWERYEQLKFNDTYKNVLLEVSRIV